MIGRMHRFVSFGILTFCSMCLWLATGCATEDSDVIPIDSLRTAFFDRTIPFDFEENPQGWQGSFADYPLTLADTLALEFSYTILPENFEKRGSALRWSGFNFQNDLFMFAWRRIPNLSPNREYVLSFDVAIGYQVEGNEFRLRDHENRLHIKVGAINYEPRTAADEVLGRQMVNFDKGMQQSIDGRDMMWLGELIAGELKYKDKILTNAEQRLFGIKSNEAGEIWVLVGVESSIPLHHSVYLDEAIVYLSEQ